MADDYLMPRDSLDVGDEERLTRCGACGTEMVPCREYKQLGRDCEGTVWLCRFCRNSPVGNVEVYPGNAPSATRVLRAMGAMVNYLERRTREVIREELAQVAKPQKKRKKQ